MQICHDVPERRLRKDKHSGIRTRTLVICCSSLQLAAVQDHTVGDLRAFCAQCVGGQAQNVDKTWKKSIVEHLARLDNALTTKFTRIEETSRGHDYQFR